MVKFGDSAGLTDASVADIDRNGNQSMPFRFFFLFDFPSPSLLLRLFLSTKRKSRTSCRRQLKALAFGPLRAGGSKEIIRELVKIVHIAEDEDENFGEARVAGRSSLVSASLWWDGRRRRTIEACLTFPKWVQGKNGKNTVVAAQKR